MAYTQAQLDSIQGAYVRGVLEATLPDGSRIKYRSLDEMKQIINEIQSSLSSPTHNNAMYPTHTRGFV